MMSPHDIVSLPGGIILRVQTNTTLTFFGKQFQVGISSGKNIDDTQAKTIKRSDINGRCQITVGK